MQCADQRANVFEKPRERTVFPATRGGFVVRIDLPDINSHFRGWFGYCVAVASLLLL